MTIKLTFLLIINLSLLIECRVLILILDERLLMAQSTQSTILSMQFFNVSFIENDALSIRHIFYLNLFNSDYRMY